MIQCISLLTIKGSKTADYLNVACGFPLSPLESLKDTSQTQIWVFWSNSILPMQTRVAGVVLSHRVT